MMLKALFDEKRRAEIRDALKSNRPIEFRGKLPKAEVIKNEGKNAVMVNPFMSTWGTPLERHQAFGAVPVPEEKHQRLTGIKNRKK